MAVWSYISYRQLPYFRLDPEYYQPHYLSLHETLTKAQAVPIQQFAFVTDGIHGSPEWVDEGGVTYLSAKCVKDNFIDVSNAGKISNSQNSTNPRTQARIDDVLITSVGTIGNAAVVDADILPANMDRHLGIIRVRADSGVDPYYLATFLNCEYGRFQSMRESTGNVQLNLFIEKIKTILVPMGEHYNRVGEVTRQTYQKRKEAHSFYKQAEARLLEALGLQNIDLSHQVAYTGSFREAVSAHRLDAEYFQPKYYRILDAMDRSGFQSTILGSIIEPIRNGFDFREFSEEGTPYIRVGDIRNGKIDVRGAVRVRIKAEEVKKNVRLSVGDLLFTRKGSYGNAAVVRDGAEQAIISSEIMLLRIRPEYRNQVDPDYLALFLNSSVGFEQIERRVHGVAFYSISQQDLSGVCILFPSLEEQRELAHLVFQSQKLEETTYEMLDYAKEQIESLIQKA
jgi:type I restriction enzyme M protein